MKLVIMESPYMGATDAIRYDNIHYARTCVRDCIQRGEAPIASHLLFTQPGILNDDNSEERTLGIEAGLAWIRVAETTVVYTDRGISSGMRMGIERAKSFGVPIEYRSLYRET